MNFLEENKKHKYDTDKAFYMQNYEAYHHFDFGISELKNNTNLDQETDLQDYRKYFQNLDFSKKTEIIWYNHLFEKRGLTSNDEYIAKELKKYRKYKELHKIDKEVEALKPVKDVYYLRDLIPYMIKDKKVSSAYINVINSKYRDNYIRIFGTPKPQ